MLACAVERRRAPSETRLRARLRAAGLPTGLQPTSPRSNAVVGWSLEACTLLAALEVLTTTVVDNNRETMPDELPPSDAAPPSDVPVPETRWPWSLRGAWSGRGGFLRWSPIAIATMRGARNRLGRAMRLDAPCHMAQWGWSRYQSVRFLGKRPWPAPAACWTSGVRSLLMKLSRFGGSRAPTRNAPCGKAGATVGLTHQARHNAVGASRLVERAAGRLEAYEQTDGPTYELDLAGLVARVRGRVHGT
jgi:hypothetical protein